MFVIIWEDSRGDAFSTLSLDSTNSLSESLESLKDWVLDETEHRFKAAEAMKGVKTK